jgi:hypothetical protein
LAKKAAVLSHAPIIASKPTSTQEQDEILLALEWLQNGNSTGKYLDAQACVCFTEHPRGYYYRAPSTLAAN